MARGSGKGSRGSNKLRNPEGFGVKTAEEAPTKGLPIAVGKNGKEVLTIDDIQREPGSKEIFEGMNGEVLGMPEEMVASKDPELARHLKEDRGIAMLKRKVLGDMVYMADNNASGDPDNSGYVVRSGRFTFKGREYLITGEGEYGADNDGRVKKDSFHTYDFYIHRVK